MDSAPRRLAAYLILLTLGALALPTRATEVYGTIANSFGVPYGGQVNTIEFTPLSAPQIYGTNTVWPVAVSRKLTNGTFRVNLVGGLYWAGLLGDDPNTGSARKTVKILVPPDIDPLAFNDAANLATNLGTFIYTNTPTSGPYFGDGAGITNIQASNIVGLVTTGVITNNQTGVTLGGAFSGDGAGLTNLSPAAIATTADRLIEWTASEAYQPTNITADANGIVQSVGLRWPDGASGLLTATATNATWLTVDGFTITHAAGWTVTQPAVSRNQLGIVTNKPLLTVTQ